MELSSHNEWNSEMKNSGIHLPCNKFLTDIVSFLQCRADSRAYPYTSSIRSPCTWFLAPSWHWELGSCSTPRRASLQWPGAGGTRPEWIHRKWRWPLAQAGTSSASTPSQTSTQVSRRRTRRSRWTASPPATQGCMPWQSQTKMGQKPPGTASSGCMVRFDAHWFHHAWSFVLWARTFCFLLRRELSSCKFERCRPVWSKPWMGNKGIFNPACAAFTSQRKLSDDSKLHLLSLCLWEVIYQKTKVILDCLFS